MAEGGLIRLATLADIPRLVEMGQEFRRQTSYSNHLADNPAKMAETAGQLIEKQGVLVLERDDQVVGMLGFLVFPHFLSGENVAVEIFWWVDPQHRGRGLALIREAERRAKSSGAKQIQMIAPNDQVAAIYRRMRYQFVEATYQRTL